MYTRNTRWDGVRTHVQRVDGLTSVAADGDFLFSKPCECPCPVSAWNQCVKKVKVSSYKAQYPVLRTVQSALHFTSLTDRFTQTSSRLLWEASSHMLQLMREVCSYTYLPLSIVKYLFIQPSELEQCRVKKLAQCVNTAAQDSDPGSRSRESEALPLSHCALCVNVYYCYWLLLFCWQHQ